MESMRKKEDKKDATFPSSQVPHNDNVQEKQKVNLM